MSPKGARPKPARRNKHNGHQGEEENGSTKGVEFRIAEAGSGTTRTTGQIPLPDLENTHAQFAHIHFSNTASSISNPPFSARVGMTVYGASSPLSDARGKVPSANR